MKRRHKRQGSRGGGNKQFKSHFHADRNAAVDEGRVQHAKELLRLPATPRYIYVPANLVTHRLYTGQNVGYLSSLAPHDPYFATFKQLASYGLSVRAGEKAKAYIKVYHDVEEKDADTREPTVTWTPVFHYTQLAQPVPDRVSDLRLLHLKACCPVWLQKLTQLYEQRLELADDHVLAMKASNVPPLMLLATRAAMLHHHTYTPERIRDIISPDIVQFMWPLCGIAAADQLLATLVAAHPACGGEPQWHLLVPRSHYQHPEGWYIHCLYLLANTILYGEPLGGEPDSDEAVLTCLLAALQRALTIGLALGSVDTQRVRSAKRWFDCLLKAKQDDLILRLVVNARL